MKLRTSRMSLEDYVELAQAVEESRQTIRGYVADALERGYEPSTSDFIAEYNTPSTRWDYDAVDAEIERVLFAEQLRKDVRDYVKAGGWDSLGFALLSAPKYNNVPGREIQRLIDAEREALI